MDISYRLNNNQIEKLKKYKNPSILLNSGNILKNGKHKLHLTVGMFNNKLFEQGELKYVFTDKRKNYYLQQGGSKVTFLKLFYHMQRILLKRLYLLWVSR